MMVARRSGAVVSTNSMLSRKKGRHYGESHQKALQISVRLLPLVGVLVGGRERASCQASGPSAILGLWVSMPVLPCGGESVPLPTRRRGAGRNVMVYLVTKQLKYPLQRSSDDGGEVVGGATVAETEHNAVEIPTRVVDSRIVECEDGHPRGWPLLFVPHAPPYGQLQVQNTGSGILDTLSP